MHGLLHTLNIGTLATWISVAGFGGVAVFAPEKQIQQIPAKPPETQLIQEEFTLGEQNPVEGPASTPSVPDRSEPAEILPTPPELPEFAESAPLPEIPDLPVPASPAPIASAAPPVSSARRNTEVLPQSGTARTGTSRPSASGPRASASGGTMSESSRLAAGRMPPPSYPAEAKRKNQTGTVLVEFTVDSNGSVISAYAKSSSSWPLLDSEALRTVRRWKFPAGPVMKLQRPIVFQLR